MSSMVSIDWASECVMRVIGMTVSFNGLGLLSVVRIKCIRGC